MVATVVAVVVVAVAAVVVASVREPAELPESSPGAVVQRYLRAVADGDRDAAEATFTAALAEGCRVVTSQRPMFPPGAPSSFEARLAGTRQLGDDTVEVRVELVESAGGPFGGGYERTEVFVVERTGDGWGLAEVSWPHYVCPPERGP